MAVSALDIAHKLIAKAAEDGEGGELLTNLKLQKLLYYEQGYHLATFGTPLFEEAIESWKYGPVVPIVYDHYSVHGKSPLPKSPKTLVSLPNAEEMIFNKVYNKLRGFSALGLMDKTHEELPWIESTPHCRGTIIPQNLIMSYFKTSVLPGFLKSEIIKDLNILASLPDDWDIYGTPAPTTLSIEQAKTVISKLSESLLPYTTISPSGIGSIDINIKRGGNMIGINTGDDTMSWYIKKCNNEPELYAFVNYTDDNLALLSTRSLEILE